MVNFGYPYNDIVICKDSTDYLANYNYRKYIFVSSHQNINYSTDCYWKFVKSIINNDIYIQVLSAFNDYSLLFRKYLLDRRQRIHRSNILVL